MSNMYWLVPLLYYPAWQFDILGQIIWFCLKSINFLHSSRAYNWDSFNFYSFRLTEMNGLRMELTSRKARWFGPKTYSSFIHQQNSCTSSDLYIYSLYYTMMIGHLRRPADMLKFWECLHLQSATVYPNLCYGYRYTHRYL